MFDITYEGLARTLQDGRKGRAGLRVMVESVTPNVLPAYSAK